MSTFKHVSAVFFIVMAIWVIQPIVAYAFTLVELSIELQLEPEQQYSLDYAQFDFPNTGFTITNPGQQAINLLGNSTLALIEDPQTATKQEDFVLLDTTMLLELSATDAAGGRAGIRATYRMNVPPGRLEPEALANLLLDQGIVSDIGRANVRAQSMGLADARVMRLYHDEGEARWVRAVRAIRANDVADLDVRFTPRMEPDGILGHYGTDIDVSGNAYVWAVMDRNSNYAVGFTVDRDDDGIVNADDNCIDIINPGQDNHDTDALGDACDDNDDNDSLPDNIDNCPLDANDDQADSDADGTGDACDSDDDNDGVNDGIDECTGTQAGAIVNAYGCSIEDTCRCENEWKNHGAYVRCSVREANAFVAADLISKSQRDSVVSSAGQSDCGKRQQ